MSLYSAYHCPFQAGVLEKLVSKILQSVVNSRGQANKPNLPQLQPPAKVSTHTNARAQEERSSPENSRYFLQLLEGLPTNSRAEISSSLSPPGTQVIWKLRIKAIAGSGPIRKCQGARQNGLSRSVPDLQEGGLCLCLTLSRAPGRQEDPTDQLRKG